MEYVWVAIGGALGASGRHFFAGLVDWGMQRVMPSEPIFPWGILFCNVTGSFLIGLIAALSMAGGRVTVPPEGRLLLMTGVMGGYTTFSTFSLNTLLLLRDGEYLFASANVLGSVVMCILGVYLGFVLGLAISRP